MNSPIDIGRRLSLSGLLVAALLPAPLCAQVRVEGGYVFPEQAQVGGSTLRLNGVGYRAVAWFRGYAAGLYLASQVKSVEGVLAMEGPKRLRLRMLIGVPAVEFVKAFDKGLARNTPAAELPALRERMKLFDERVEALGQVRAGDLVDLDFLPGQGLQLLLNGETRGAAIPGADLYAALLRLFIGQRPADPEMKTGLLGGPLG